MTAHILGAQYTHRGRLYRLIGKRRTVSMYQQETTGKVLQIPRMEDEHFVATGVHDHENFCCPEHNTHVSPHRGCILR